MVTNPTVTFSLPKHVKSSSNCYFDSPIVGGGVSVTSAIISIGGSSLFFPGGTTGSVFYAKAPTVTLHYQQELETQQKQLQPLMNYDSTGGTISALGLTTGGRFYTSVPTVTISHPGTSLLPLR